MSKTVSSPGGKAPNTSARSPKLIRSSFKSPGQPSRKRKRTVIDDSQQDMHGFDGATHEPPRAPSPHSVLVEGQQSFRLSNPPTETQTISKKRRKKQKRRSTDADLDELHQATGGPSKVGSKRPAVDESSIFFHTDNGVPDKKSSASKNRRKRRKSPDAPATSEFHTAQKFDDPAILALNFETPTVKPFGDVQEPESLVSVDGDQSQTKKKKHKHKHKKRSKALDSQLHNPTVVDSDGSTKGSKKSKRDKKSKKARAQPPPVELNSDSNIRDERSHVEHSLVDDEGQDGYKGFDLQDDGIEPPVRKSATSKKKSKVSREKNKSPVQVFYASESEPHAGLETEHEHRKRPPRVHDERPDDRNEKGPVESNPHEDQDESRRILDIFALDESVVDDRGESELPEAQAKDHMDQTASKASSTRDSATRKLRSKQGRQELETANTSTERLADAAQGDTEDALPQGTVSAPSQHDATIMNGTPIVPMPDNANTQETSTSEDIVMATYEDEPSRNPSDKAQAEQAVSARSWTAVNGLEQAVEPSPHAHSSYTPIKSPHMPYDPWPDFQKKMQSLKNRSAQDTPLETKSQNVLSTFGKSPERSPRGPQRVPQSAQKSFDKAIQPRGRAKAQFQTTSSQKHVSKTGSPLPSSQRGAASTNKAPKVAAVPLHGTHGGQVVKGRSTEFVGWTVDQVDLLLKAASDHLRQDPRNNKFRVTRERLRVTMEANPTLEQWFHAMNIVGIYFDRDKLMDALVVAVPSLVNATEFDAPSGGSVNVPIDVIEDLHKSSSSRKALALDYLAQEKFLGSRSGMFLLAVRFMVREMCADLGITDDPSQERVRAPSPTAWSVQSSDGEGAQPLSSSAVQSAKSRHSMQRTEIDLTFEDDNSDSDEDETDPLPNAQLLDAVPDEDGQDSLPNEDDLNPLPDEDDPNPLPGEDDQDQVHDEDGPDPSLLLDEDEVAAAVDATVEQGAETDASFLGEGTDEEEEEEEPSPARHGSGRTTLVKATATAKQTASSNSLTANTEDLRSESSSLPEPSPKVKDVANMQPGESFAISRNGEVAIRISISDSPAEITFLGYAKEQTLQAIRTAMGLNPGTSAVRSSQTASTTSRGQMQSPALSRSGQSRHSEASTGNLQRGRLLQRPNDFITPARPNQGLNIASGSGSPGSLIASSQQRSNKGRPPKPDDGTCSRCDQRPKWQWYFDKIGEQWICEACYHKDRHSDRRRTSTLFHSETT